MTPRRAGERIHSAGQYASRYAVYCRYIVLLENNQQVARASSIHVEALKEFDEEDRTDYSLFLRLVHDQLAIYQEQYDDAAIDELHYTVVGKFRRIFGHRHWKTITAIHKYRQMLCGEKCYEGAKALYRTLVDECVYAKRQKLKEAEAMLVRAMVGFQRQSGESDLRTLAAAFHLSGLYQHRGKLSYAGLEETASQDSINALILKLDLGISYRNVERLKAVEALIQEVCQGLKDARSGYAPGALTCLGTLYARQGRAEEAEASFADAVKEFAVCEEEYLAMSYAAYFGLVNPLRSQRRLVEAEAMYRQAWDGARLVGGPRYATSCTIADALGAVCEEQGRHEEAEKVYKQTLASDEGHLNRWTYCVLHIDFHKMTGYS